MEVQRESWGNCSYKLDVIGIGSFCGRCLSDLEIERGLVMSTGVYSLVARSNSLGYIDVTSQILAMG